MCMVCACVTETETKTQTDAAGDREHVYLALTKQQQWCLALPQTRKQDTFLAAAQHLQSMGGQRAKLSLHRTSTMPTASTTGTFQVWQPVPRGRGFLSRACGPLLRDGFSLCVRSVSALCPPWLVHALVHGCVHGRVHAGAGKRPFESMLCPTAGVVLLLLTANQSQHGLPARCA